MVGLVQHSQPIVAGNKVFKVSKAKHLKNCNKFKNYDINHLQKILFEGWYLLYQAIMGMTR